MAKSNNLSAINSFEGGLVTDLFIGMSPSNTVTHALNMELITMGGDQYVFQNIKGNKHVLDFPVHTDIFGAKYQFIPLGLKVSNNIAYILLGAFKDNGEFVTGGIGTFPSPDWNVLNNQEVGVKKEALLKKEFAFLHNYRLPGDTIANSPFISKQFNFEKNRYIDMDIQGDFDGSVNIIFTDDKNNPNIINSRFKRIDTSQVVSLTERAGNKTSNVYSEDDWDRIALIQNNNFPIQVHDDFGVEAFTVSEGGYLRGGGYRYYFKYSTQEGNTTEVLYESPLIPISNGGLGLNKDQVSDKLIQFTLRKLDTSYAGIKVYFAHYDGLNAATVDVFKINYIFSYGADETLVITHTGLEEVSPVDPSEINVGFTPIDTIKTATIINDRLAMAGASATISEKDISILASAAKDMTLWEKSIDIRKSYADAETAAKQLGYWKGEVYELAVVFMLTNKGLSPAFPITGMDNEKGLQSLITNRKYPVDAIDPKTGFSPTYLINNKGLFRTSNVGDIYTPLPGGEAIRHVTYLEVDSSKNGTNEPLKKISTGFFIVRRKRIKNVLMQGMAVPTLKVPAKFPSLAEGVKLDQVDMIASKRYLLGHTSGPNFPTLGLNSPYYATVINKEASFNEEFDTVFVPQPAPILNVVTPEKSWFITGSVGQEIKSEAYGQTVTKDGKGTNKLHMAFYSCEIDLNFPLVSGYLNGLNPHVEVQKLKTGVSPVGYTHTALNTTTGLPAYSSTPNLIIRNAEKVSLDRALFSSFPSSKVKATLMESGKAVFGKDTFTAKIDRAIGCMSMNITGESIVADGEATKISYILPFMNFGIRGSRGGVAGNKTENVLYSNSKKPNDYMPYSLVTQSYSRYLGIEVIDIDSIGIDTKNVFNYMRSLVSIKSWLVNQDGVMMDNTGEYRNRKFTSVGHLANVFRSSTGRWSQNNIIDIYKYDSNKVYHAVTNRMPIESKRASVFRGDGFISRIFKRVTYKNGVPTAKSATTADAANYGLGLLTVKGRNAKTVDLIEVEKDDLGRGLYDVGQILEIAAYSNINADIRSKELLSPEDSLIHGGDRDFYPNKQYMFDDKRPDSTAYNHGYTGDENLISYSRIEENSPSFNTEFPNRILLSEKNRAQGFFNAFRDLKGFNYRDYGVELGPIIKLVAIRSVLLSIHPTGVLAIGVDDRTLIAEGSDVFVNTAQALSPTSKSISNMYGAIHAEAVVNTDTTVAGVDYNASAVWMYEGDKLTIISEFAVKILLERFKSRIEKGNLTKTDAGVSYTSRVYSTFNHSKHTLYISYVAENPQNKSQIHVGTLSYNTVLQKWMSELSEGNKFSIYLGSSTFTTGFSTIKGLWEEDALKDPTTGKHVRCSVRGVVDYGYEFEIVINKEPSLEKVLDNIKAITNKSIPVELVYTTSGDENDAAIDIWGSDDLEKITRQKIITRNSSGRKHLRLGILDENAYYKNSGLYIEVGKLSTVGLPSNTPAGNRQMHKRIRDKSIRVKFIYKGNDETFIQAIISTLSISYN